MSTSYTMAMVTALYCNQGPVIDGSKCEDGTPAHTIELEFLKWNWPNDDPPEPWKVPDAFLNVAVDGKVVLQLQPGNLTHEQLVAISKAVLPADSWISISSVGAAALPKPGLSSAPTQEPSPEPPPQPLYRPFFSPIYPTFGK